VRPSSSTVAAAESPTFVGFGSTDRATLNALRRPHRRFAPLMSPTVNWGITVSGYGFTEALPGFTHLRAAERVSFANYYVTTEGDLGALRWDLPHRLLTFDASTFIVQASAIHITHLPLVNEYVMDRIRALPFRCNRTAASVVNTTARGLFQSSSNVLSSTDPLLAPSDFVRRKAVDIFTAAVEETFEDGMESNFSQSLATLLKAHGTAALAAVEDLILSPETNVEVAVEAARLLGAADDPTSRSQRRAFLEKLLSLPSVRIRHAAASGLAAMDDPGSLPALAGAIEREDNRRLRQYLRLVVDQLERAK